MQQHMEGERPREPLVEGERPREPLVVGKRSTLNAQLSTFKRQRCASEVSVERWMLRV
jgi:hypothetical protein